MRNHKPRNRSSINLFSKTINVLSVITTILVFIIAIADISHISIPALNPILHFLGNLPANILPAFSVITAITSVFTIIISALSYITSGGDAGKISRAKTFIIYNVLIIIVLAIGTTFAVIYLIFAKGPQKLQIAGAITGFSIIGGLLLKGLSLLFIFVILPLLKAIPIGIGGAIGAKIFNTAPKYGKKKSPRKDNNAGVRANVIVTEEEETTS